MTDMREPVTAPDDEQRTQTRLAVGAMVVPLFFAAMFAACIIGTYHKPHPNGIKVGVVGPSALTARLRAGIEKAAGSVFDVRPVATVAQATRDVRQRDLNAAFVPTANPKRPATVVVATAGGRLVAVAAETLARSVAAGQGSQLEVRDVRPLASGDAVGLGVFMFTIVCTICGYIGPTILETATPALRPSRRYPILAGTAVLVAALVYLIGGLGFGTYTGSPRTILGFVAIGALYTFSISLGTRLFQVLLGLPAILVSLGLLVFLNIPSLGATYTATMLPPFWRFLNHFWIGATAVNAERSLVYFDGHGAGTDVVKLLAWMGVFVALLLLPASRKLERKRERSEVGAASRPPTRQFAEQP